MNTFKISIHPTAWEGKPKTATEKASLARDFNPTELNLEGLAQYINNGHTISPSLLKDGYRNAKNFISSQVIMLDYDDNQSIEDEINKLKEINLNPNLVYNSFSHKPSFNKFRLVIVLDAAIEDEKLFKSILRALINKVGSDKAAKSSAQMFYGGNNATILDAQLNEYNKAKVVLTGLINLEVSNRTKDRNRNMFKNDAKTEMPYILKESRNMRQNSTYRDFDFTYASTTSNVFEQFSNNTIELSYAQLFNLVSNMQYVEGGRKWVKSKMTTAN